MIPGTAYLSRFSIEYGVPRLDSAFNAFFKDPKWEVKAADNGATFVLFSGSLKKDMLPDVATFGIDWHWKNGDIVRIKFAISSDSSSFELWSVQMGDGVEVRGSDWERRKALDILFEAIYKIQ
jgi:hypothetical protein